MKKILGIMLTIMFAVSIATSVSAFGIGAPYWNDNPLVLYPGESEDFAFTLQNMGSTDAVTMTVELTGDETIVSLLDADNEYLVPVDASNVKVNLRATMPADAEIGTEYAYTALFRSVKTSEGGGISLGSAFEKQFKVVAGGEPAEEEKTPAPVSNAVWAIVIIVVLVLLWWLLQKNKKRR